MAGLGSFFRSSSSSLAAGVLTIAITRTRLAAAVIGALLGIILHLLVILGLGYNVCMDVATISEPTRRPQNKSHYRRTQ